MKEERQQEAMEIWELIRRQEALAALGKLERKRVLNRERQRRRRERKHNAKVCFFLSFTHTLFLDIVWKQMPLCYMNDIFVPLTQTMSPNELKTPEHSQPHRLFVEKASVDHDTRGRKCKHVAKDAKTTNWVNLLLWTQIENAACQVGPSMQPLAIIKLLKARNPQHFAALTPQVLG